MVCALMNATPLCLSAHFRRHGWAVCLLALLGWPVARCQAQAPSSNAFWRTQSIYQIITDRFYDGNTANDNAEGTYAPSNPTGPAPNTTA